jgi:PAS domain S-box-containing protein
MRDGVIVVDSQNRIMDVNIAAERIIGQSHSKVFGLLLGEVWPELQCQLGRTKTGTPSEMTVERENEERTYDVNVSLLTNWHGQLLSQVIVLRDITELKIVEEEALERKKTELNTFINNIPDLAWIKDSESRFIAVNRAFADAVGMDPESLIHHTCEVCFGEEKGKKFREDDLQVMESKRQSIIEEKIIDSQNREIWLETIKSPMFDRSGNVIGTVGIARDITYRKEMEEALRKSETKYRTIFETTGTATAIVDEDTTIELVNSEVERLSGYTKEEIEGKSWMEFVAREDLERLKEYHRLRRIDPNSAPRNYEFRVLVKQGDIREAFITVDLIPGTTKTVISLLDITDHKRVNEVLKESEKKLRLFSSHLISAQETERKKISKELHDELGQALIALKLRLGSIHRKLGKEQIAFINECEFIQKDVNQIIENVRRLSRDLGPYTLEHLGLWAALRWLTEDFSKYYQVQTSFDILDSDRPLPPGAQLNIFRTFQEAFTNIQKHAQATNVLIAISQKDGSLSFFIEDDGKGFDLNQEKGRNGTEKGLGLAIMEERIRMLGGTFDIWSQEGKGTKISFTIPVSREGNAI